MVSDAAAPSGNEPAAHLDGEGLDLAGGLMFILDVRLSDLEPGQVLELTSDNPALVYGLPAWCRGTGNELMDWDMDGDRVVFRIRRGRDAVLMFRDRPDLGIDVPDRHDGFGTTDWLIGRAGVIPDQADARSGFSPRGAAVEDGSPEFPFTLTERDQVWASNVASLCDQAVAG